MRKGRDGEKNGKKRGEKKDTDENSGHYVIASSRPPERRPLERRTLAPIVGKVKQSCNKGLIMVAFSPEENKEKSPCQNDFGQVYPTFAMLSSFIM